MSGDIYETVSGFVSSRTQTMKDQVARTYSELVDRSLTLRLALIVGGYLVFRPYIQKLFDWGLRRKMAKEEEEKKKKKESRKKSRPTVDTLEGPAPAKTDPNTLRYGHLKDKVDVSDDTDSEEDEKQKGRPMTEEEQGEQKARRRQRRVLRAKLDEDELRQLEEDEWNDPDLEDLLAPKR